MADQKKCDRPFLYLRDQQVLQHLLRGEQRYAGDSVQMRPSWLQGRDLIVPTA